VLRTVKSIGKWLVGQKVAVESLSDIENHLHNIVTSNGGDFPLGTGGREQFILVALQTHRQVVQGSRK
jgi:hypothetical protein